MTTKEMSRTRPGRVVRKWLYERFGFWPITNVFSITFTDGNTIYSAEQNGRRLGFTRDVNKIPNLLHAVGVI